MNRQLASLCVQKLSVPTGNPPQQLPLHLSSSFSFETVEESIAVFEGQKEGFVYSRYANPTISALAQRIADLEAFDTGIHAHALMTSSGMAAIHVLMLALFPKGGKLLTQGNLYGGTTELFIKVLAGLNIEPVFADLRDAHQVEDFLQNNPDTGAIFLETPSNPGMDIVDLATISSIAKRYGCKTIVDNTCCTPLIQRPMSHGIDFVIHSTTKYLNGHGTGIAGIIVSPDESWMRGRVWEVLKLTGATCNAFDAWMVANGLRTLALRMQRHSENAGRLAHFLMSHPAVSRVNYPGLNSHPGHALASRQMDLFGGLLSFEVAGGRDAALRVMNKLRLASIAPTFGDVETLVLHPATSSHLKVPLDMRLANGITDGLVRVSTGIEAPNDLISDFEEALRG